MANLVFNIVSGALPVLVEIVELEYSLSYYEYGEHTIYGLEPGTYTLHCTDINGCEVTIENIVITEQITTTTSTTEESTTTTTTTTAEGTTTTSTTEESTTTTTTTCIPDGELGDIYMQSISSSYLKILDNEVITFDTVEEACNAIAAVNNGDGNFIFNNSWDFNVEGTFYNYFLYTCEKVIGYFVSHYGELDYCIHYYDNNGMFSEYIFCSTTTTTTLEPTATTTTTINLCENELIICNTPPPYSHWEVKNSNDSVGQTFIIPECTIDSIKVSIPYSGGNPDYDLRLSIYDLSGGFPNSKIDDSINSVNLTADNVGEFTFNFNTFLLSGSYAFIFSFENIVLFDSTNYHGQDIKTPSSYADGNLIAKSSGSWSNWVDYDLWSRICYHITTTTTTSEETTTTTTVP